MNFANQIWNRASEMADRTPDDRNRTVDFLRAASIGVVVVGHWLMIAPYVSGGELAHGNLLSFAEWTHWITLVVQVMPIFFLVGGYANAVAWRRAREKGTPYGTWLGARMQRLIGPVVPVLVIWFAISLGTLALGGSAEWIGRITQAVLVPTWFLAVYVMVGVCVPLTIRAWEKFGFGSVAALAIGAAAIDAIAISNDMRSIGMINYGFVWLAVHQLGHAWRDGRIAHPLAWSVAGASVLTALVEFGPYPLAMVGVPGQQLGNTSPPTLALLALGVTQMGLVLAAEKPLARSLAGSRAWTSTVLINGMIMTLYLWHMTAAVIVFCGAVLLGNLGLQLIPNTADWWLARPIWIACFFAVLVPLVLTFSKFERASTRPRTVSRSRLVTGASLTAAGLGALATHGFAETSGGLRLIPSLLPFVGTGIVGIGPLGGLLTRGSHTSNEIE
jgi:hypothetical protein